MTVYFQFIGKSPILTHSAPHVHEAWEIVLNTQGEGQTLIGGQGYAFGAGTVVCIPPNTPHAKQSSGGFQDMYILFPALALERRVAVFKDEDGRMEQLMSLLHNCYHRRDNNYKEISDHLAQALEQLVRGKLCTAPTDPRVAKIAEMAVEHFTDPDFSMAQAIADSGYCEDHLRRLFRKQYGQSPLEYITALRIHYAKRLLRESERLHYTVTEIASMVGFSDVCYFSRIFKKHVGVSPRAYMQKESLSLSQ